VDDFELRNLQQFLQFFNIRQSTSQFFWHVGGCFIGGPPMGLEKRCFQKMYPSISAKISIILPIIVLFLSKISLYEGFLLFLPQNKEEI